MGLPLPDKGALRTPAEFTSALVDASAGRLRQERRSTLSNITRELLSTLEKNHTEMITRAQEDFGLDLTALNQPAWLQKELRDKRPLSNDVNLYINKEAARGAHLARTLVPLTKDAPEGPLVDIGTRAGFFPNTLLQLYGSTLQNRHISGLDLRQDLPTQNHPDCDFRKGYPPLVREYDGKHMPDKDASLAIATLNCVLHHIEPPRRNPKENSPELDAFLAELKRVMKPGGVVLITEDFMGKTKAERKAGNPYADTVLATDDLFHPHSLGSQRSQEEWVAILEKAGFAVDLQKHVAAYNTAGFPTVELVIKAHKP